MPKPTIDQPTRRPTRKILAVIIAGAVTGAVQAGLQMFLPDLPIAPLMAELDIWIQAAVMAAAGYAAREWG